MEKEPTDEQIRDAFKALKRSHRIPPMEKEKENRIREEFDEKFEEFYDLDIPTNENMDAGSEITHYCELKQWIISKLSQALAERDEEIREKIKSVKGWATVGGERYIKVETILALLTPKDK